MKYLLIFLVILSHLNLYSQSKKINTTKIEYVKAYKNISDSSNSKPKPLKNLNYLLLFDEKQSIFYQSKNMLIDGDYTNKRLAMKGGGRGIYYKNILEKNKINILKQDGKNFFVKKEYRNWDWKILKETKKIMGYTCLKAIGKLEQYNYILKENKTLTVTVWFTREIPVSFGPSGFDGLPGLVLESKRGSFYFIATKINFDQNDKIILPKDGIIIEDEEFAKMQYEAFMSYVND